MIKRSQNNFAVIKKWVESSDWLEFLAEEEDTRSRTSICLSISHEKFLVMDDEGQKKFIKDLVKMAEEEEVAYDIANYRDAPNGLRIWGGGTIEASDLQFLTACLDSIFKKLIN